MPEQAHVGPVVGVLAGATCIAASAVLVRLAGSSAGAAAVLRCGFALPLLGALAVRDRRRGSAPLSRRVRWGARVSGLFLAADLVLWTHSIDAVGAGLATVLGNLQVLLIGALAWWLLGERPARSTAITLPIMLAGVVLVAGVVGGHAYGRHPVVGVIYGAVSSVCYAGFLLLLRQSTGPDRQGRRIGVVQPLFEATLGGAVGSVLIALATRDFRIGPLWPALGWLALLAVSSQVIGWLLITTSLPQLDAATTSMLLLVQPVGAVALAAAVFGEHPSAAQLGGVALILLGAVITARAEARRGARGQPVSVDAGPDASDLDVRVTP